ncbi:hypothetical protein A2U01_0072188, partial [Trifolium medium]|nr:hypothetical protein [Trifolium medium]
RLAGVGGGNAVVVQWLVGFDDDGEIFFLPSSFVLFLALFFLPFVLFQDGEIVLWFRCGDGRMCMVVVVVTTVLGNYE